MSEITSITPTRPYMVRALYQWIEDNDLTPYLMVDATAENVQIPTEHVQDGRIVLNIASRATGNMSMEND
ncbi:MAG: ClpXP protease specificity-enhancing factor SspB, partial [Psychrobacter alimentarius]